MRNLWNMRAALLHHSLDWAKLLYVVMLLVWSVLTMWRVASGSLLETPDASPTLIKIDLLEAVAFLAAWSLLVITITTKVVNKSRDIEFAADESVRKLDDMEVVMQRHEEGHPDIQSEIERIQAEVADMAEKVMQAERESER